MKKNILIIEDEMITAILLKKEFEKKGYKVLSVLARGEELCECVVNNIDKPDYIICDIQLAGVLNGIDAVTQLFTHIKIPVIFLSGFGDELTIRKTESLSPLGFLTKPFDFRRILSLIEAHNSK